VEGGVWKSPKINRQGEAGEKALKNRAFKRSTITRENKKNGRKRKK